MYNNWNPGAKVAMDYWYTRDGRSGYKTLHGTIYQVRDGGTDHESYIITWDPRSDIVVMSDLQLHGPFFAHELVIDHMY